jgi:hypothetical protein
MSNQSTASSQVFDLLEGTWAGEGRGQYPTITSFDYRETLAFTRRDEKTLAYEQRTQKQMDGQSEWLVSHWESGFIRVLEGGELELVNAQSGGRSEVLTGTVEMSGSTFTINFLSRTITNDPRMVSSARRFELEGDTLRYEMNMQTTKTSQLTSHLKIELKRVK